jgi:hypothetical protein
MEFFPEIPISEEQAQAIARGLFTVAAVDGVHEREATLIADFYGATTGGDAPPVTSLAEIGRRGPLAPADLAAALPGDELRQLFFKAALLLAYVDGKVTPASQPAARPRSRNPCAITCSNRWPACKTPRP